MPFNQVIKEIKKVMSRIAPSDTQTFVNEVQQAKRVFVIGVGRSGLVAKNLAMRLVRLEKEAYVVHETVTPKMKTGDLLIAISGSGETTDVLDTVKISRMMGVRILTLTAVKNSSIIKISHSVILIPAEVPTRIGDRYHLRELIGVPERSSTKSLFELCALIFLEVGVSRLKGDNDI